MTLNHPVYRALWDRHTGNVAIMADSYNRAEASRLMDIYEERWARGDSFPAFESAQYEAAALGALFGAPIPREGDTEEEINAAADQLYELLLGVVIRGWVDSLSRETVVAILNQMDIIKISICGRQLDACDIELRWNDMHPDEKIIHTGANALQN